MEVESNSNATFTPSAPASEPDHPTHQHKTQQTQTNTPPKKKRTGEAGGGDLLLDGGVELVEVHVRVDGLHLQHDLGAVPLLVGLLLGLLVRLGLGDLLRARQRRLGRGVVLQLALGLGFRVQASMSIDPKSIQAQAKGDLRRRPRRGPRRRRQPGPSCRPLRVFWVG